MRALLIENHKPLARALKRGLEAEGYTVDLADSAADADSKARVGRYEVILVDLMTPRVEGLTLLQPWRKGGLGPRILFLNTPRVKENHAAERPAQDSIVRVDDLEIDTWTRTVKRAGRLVRLTPREYSLLLLLASQRGQVVTRTRIWEHLYDEHDVNSSNVIDVYIRYLRIKIDKGFDKPLIRTLWGKGYLLRGDGD